MPTPTPPSEVEYTSDGVVIVSYKNLTSPSASTDLATAIGKIPDLRAF